MFVKFIKNTTLLKIIFIATLHQHTFAECFYDCCDCCKDCCDCCNPDVITEEDILKAPDVITEEDILKAEENYKYPEEIEITTQKILKHLKLDNGELNDIAVEINNIQNNEEKIKKIIEYSKDIDWEHECCPNTLIRWENNECAYIAYFHLMLNNPYFLKFFLICNETMRRNDTYVLNSICDLVKYCVEHPRFEGKYRGSVDKIMKAFFRKDADKEYFYLKRENGTSLKEFYYKKNKNGKISHYYGSFLPHDVYLKVNKCLYIDLNLENKEIMDKIIIRYDADMNDYTLSICIENGEKVEKTLLELLQKKRKNLNDKEDAIVTFEEQFGSGFRKVLGIWFSQYKYHFFVFTKNNGKWYNKNTLNYPSGQELSQAEVLDFCKKLPLFPKRAEFKTEEDFDKEVYKKIYCNYSEIVLFDIFD